VPFSIFPSSYKEGETQTTTETHEEVELKLPEKKAGREGQYSSSFSATTTLPPRKETRFSEEEVRITREEERYRRPGTQHHHHEEFYEERRSVHVGFPQSSHQTSRVQRNRETLPRPAGGSEIARWAGNASFCFFSFLSIQGPLLELGRYPQATRSSQ
jgi:hypothetical protein